MLDCVENVLNQMVVHVSFGAHGFVCDVARMMCDLVFLILKRASRAERSV